MIILKPTSTVTTTQHPYNKLPDPLCGVWGEPNSPPTQQASLHQTPFLCGVWGEPNSPPIQQASLHQTPSLCGVWGEPNSVTERSLVSKSHTASHVRLSYPGSFLVGILFLPGWCVPQGRYG